MEPLFTWLHLSDIHVGHGDASHGWDQQLVLDQLLADVKENLSKNAPNPDAIFVTGDLAFSGNVRRDIEYEQLNEWLTKLSQSINVDQDRTFLVPGNHDVQRDGATKDRSIARLLKDLRSDGDNIDNVLADPRLYKEIASVQEALGNTDLRAIALEKVAEENPNDTDELFNSAYALSQTQFSEVALFNYKTLLQFEPKHSIALNNTGVQYQALKMPIRAVQSYKSSTNLKNTLAMANLAYLYFEQGFSEEARLILEKAKVEDDVHTNVGLAKAALDKAEEEEKKKEETVESIAIKQKQFLRNFADAWFIAAEERVLWEGEWNLPNGEKVIVIHKDHTAVGLWGTGDIKQRFTGTIRTRGARIVLQKWQKNIWGEGGSFGSDVKGYAYTNKEGTELCLMIADSDQKRFLRLKRSDPLS